MKTLWFRYTYIVFVLSSKFRPRVIPMLYSFYLIVYLICISYFIIIFPFLCVVVFCMWVIYRIFFYHWYFYVCCFGDYIWDRDYRMWLYYHWYFPLYYVFVLGSMIISGILFIYYFYDDFLSLIMWYELSLTYDNLFFFFMCLFWVMGI